jgi:hypothetical protein
MIYFSELIEAIMKQLSFGALIFSLITVLSAQGTVQVSSVVVRQLDNNIIRITVEVANQTKREVSEIAGYIDIYDNAERVIEKKFMQILHDYEVPLRPSESKSRSIVLTRRPNMSGTARFRITRLRFFGEKDLYMVCPECGEIIPKDE